MSRKIILTALAAAVVVGVLIYNSEAMREARFVSALVDRNIEARGGLEAWEAVGALSLAGQMDLGQGMVVPYTLEQKRPGKMCLKFEFDSELSKQCSDGETGWKITPFRGRYKKLPQPMTEAELRETVDSSDPYGLLYDYSDRGHDIELVGKETVDGREIYKLQVTLPRGGVRSLYIDAETALETRLETRREIVGREQLVETRYVEWMEIEGLLIPSRQETRIAGEDESHFITVESVIVNPTLDDSDFAMPGSVNASNGSPSSNAS
jgi:hypothetical protein